MGSAPQFLFCINKRCLVLMDVQTDLKTQSQRWQDFAVTSELGQATSLFLVASVYLTILIKRSTFHCTSLLPSPLPVLVTCNHNYAKLGSRYVVQIKGICSN